MKYIITTLMMMALILAGCGGQAKAQNEPSKTETEEKSQEGEVIKGDMTAESLKKLLLQFDSEAKEQGNAIQFTLLERDLMMVFDEKADRMRVVTPIANAGLLDEALMERMLQANFDAVLDVRYAVANNLVWVVYIHKLSTVTQDDFLSGIAQAVTAAETFGTSYTSGAMVFGGGDSNAIHEDLIKKLEEAIKKEGKTKI